MKKVHVIDHDLNTIKKATLKFDKKNNTYYLSYSTLLFARRIPVDDSLIKYNVFYVKDRKVYAIDLDAQNAQCINIDHLRNMLATKIIANLMSTPALEMLLFILLGAAVGVGVGFMLHSYVPPPLPPELSKILNTTLNATVK